MTRLEMAVVIATLAALAAISLPALARAKAKAIRINCVSNLKAGECAFRLWAGDNNDQYPMAISTNRGGAREWALAGQVFEVFRVMSNELSTPKILFCPADNRVYATNWSRFDNRHLSYFLGVDAPCRDNTNAPRTSLSLFLYGDRNLTNDTRPENGIIQLTPNQKVRWTVELHKFKGNVCLTDGAAFQLDNRSLPEIIRATDTVTNRLAIP